MTQKRNSKGQFAKESVPHNKGKKFSKTIKQKMSDAAKKRYAKGYVAPMKGKTFTEEHRKKLSESRQKLLSKGWISPMKGKSHSDESKQKMKTSIKNLYAKGYVHPHKGKKFSKEYKKKLSQAQKNLYAKGYVHPMTGQTHSQEARKIIKEKRLHQVFPTTDTKLEKVLQKLLKTNKIKFKTHVSILGQPDVFIKPNICIFADGDYWHGWYYLNGKNYSTQKSINNEWFKNKIKYDTKITSDLKKLGYSVLRFWEHEINEEPEKCLKKILKAIKA